MTALPLPPGTVVSVNVAPRKGERKLPVAQAVLRAGHGIEGDAHAGSDRQVSLLAQESVSQAAAAAVTELRPGDFGENLTLSGLDLASLSIGACLSVGSEAVLEISEIGKTCHEPCSIGRRLGECVMPTAGVFAKVLRGGLIVPGDEVRPAPTEDW